MEDRPTPYQLTRDKRPPNPGSLAAPCKVTDLIAEQRATIARLTAENERLRGMILGSPVLADGSIGHIGMQVWLWRNGGIHTGWVTQMDAAQCWLGKNIGAAPWDDCYSTREAAEHARSGEGEK